MHWNKDKKGRVAITQRYKPSGPLFTKAEADENAVKQYIDFEVSFSVYRRKTGVCGPK